MIRKLMLQISPAQKQKRLKVKVRRDSESNAWTSVKKFASRSADVLLAGMDIVRRRGRAGGDLGRTPVSITSA